MALAVDEILQRARGNKLHSQVQRLHRRRLVADDAEERHYVRVFKALQQRALLHEFLQESHALVRIESATERGYRGRVCAQQVQPLKRNVMVAVPAAAHLSERAAADDCRVALVDFHFAQRNHEGWDAVGGHGDS